MNIEQKIVIKVLMICDKCRTKAMKIAAKAEGVKSLAIEGEDKDKVVVIGTKVDSACLTSRLRKKLRYACLVSVEENKESGKPKEKEEKNCEEKSPCTPCYNPCQQYPMCDVVVVYNPNPPACSIM